MKIIKTNIYVGDKNDRWIDLTGSIIVLFKLDTSFGYTYERGEQYKIKV